MIPAVLPPPAADAVPSTARDHGDAEQFAHALDRETGRARPAQGAERRRPERETAEDAPGEHGRDQALLSMPVDVPARPVVAGLVPPLPAVPAVPAVDATTEPEPEVDLGLDGSAELPPVPADAAALEAAPEPAPAAAVPQPHDDPDPTVARPTAHDGEPTEAPPVAPATATSDEAPATTGPTRRADTAEASAGVPPRGGEPSEPRPADAAGRTVAEATPVRQDPTPSPAPVAAPAPAVSGAPAAGTTPPVAPAAVAQQLVEHVSPLVQGPDGTHDLTIELRPATLGLVRLEVTLEDGTLHVRVHAEDPASRRLLAQSLTDLRTALTDAGIDAGRLDVGDPGGRHDPSGGAPGDHAPGRPTVPPASASDAPTRRNPTASRTSVDVLL